MTWATQPSELRFCRATCGGTLESALPSLASADALPRCRASTALRKGLLGLFKHCRRATSHRRYARVKRRPNVKLAALFGSAAAAQSSQQRSTAYGPGARRVRPRLDSQEAGQGVGLSAPRGGETEVSGVPSLQRPTNRAMRRRPARLQAAVERSCQGEPAGPLVPRRYAWLAARPVPYSHSCLLGAHRQPRGVRGRHTVRRAASR